MEELLQQLQTRYGLSAERSQGILNTIMEFISQRVPMASGILEKFMGDSVTSNPLNAVEQEVTPAENNEGEGLLGKLEDFAKNGLKEFIPAK